MTTFKIETGIPIPPRARSTGLCDAMRSLEVGQSLVMPDKSFGSVSAYLKRTLGWKFTRRGVGEGNSRVWRIE